jgi:DNA polymerase III subunit alpha
MATQLMVRSAFSLLHSTLSIPRLVSTAKALGYTSVALTDRLSLAGVPEFVVQCQQAGLKPIVGCELHLKMDDETLALIALAKNDEGYRWLIRQSSRQNTIKLPLELNELSREAANVVFILPSVNGVFDGFFLKHDESGLDGVLRRFVEACPSFYLGITHQESAFYHNQNKQLKAAARVIGLKTVALHQVFYANSDDEERYRIVRAIDQQLTLDDQSLPKAPYRYFLEPVEMAALYDADDVIETDVIAQTCNVQHLSIKAGLPRFEPPSAITSAQYLTQLCLQGLTKRIGSKAIPAAYTQRLRDELDVIESMGYEDYFLIVWDFIRFAKKQGIYVGPGRGSAAGSLVAYVLGITHVDPLAFGLLFERFLNPERISLPDIDTDFPDDRRDEVINYVHQKYGDDHVAHIATFGTLAAKQVLRDVGRVLEIPARELDLLSKAIPNLPKVTLAETYRNVPRFRQLVDSDLRFTRLYTLALGLEGLPRHISTHAAGIVLSGRPLHDVVPLIQIESDMVSTQYTMEYLEPLGLIKMDFLGLRNLTIIDQVVTLIKTHQQHNLEILKIPLDDQKTLDLIKRVDTVGIFQLESEGMKNLLRQMKTAHFNDIVATIALFRPGPMENIPEYIRAKEHPGSIKLLHPDLELIVKDTYGILIYQEQIMQVAQRMAGFSLGKADILRKAMGKKNAETLTSLRAEFIAGCQGKGYSPELAQSLYELVFKFANYGFNKSHSVAYAMISYQMAYLKANYATMFYTALLNSVIGGEGKTGQYLEEAKAKGIAILGPSINDSDDQYRLREKGIRLPLLMIKGVGGAACREIMLERQNGPFQSYFDFVARVSARRFNRAGVEALIDAGACDEFGYSRKSLLASLEDAYAYAGLVRVDHAQQTTIDLGLVSQPPMTVVNDVALERAERERAVLGFYLSDHPLTHLKRQHGITTSLSRIEPSTSLVTVIVMVKAIKQHRTKKGDMMAFLTLSDESTEWSGVLMPNLLEKLGSQLQRGIFVMIEGVAEEENSLFIKKISVLERSGI